MQPGCFPVQGAVVPPHTHACSRNLPAFSWTILLIPDLRRVSLERDVCWLSPAPMGMVTMVALPRAAPPSKTPDEEAKYMSESQWMGIKVFCVVLSTVVLGYGSFRDR